MLMNMVLTKDAYMVSGKLHDHHLSVCNIRALKMSLYARENKNMMREDLSVTTSAPLCGKSPIYNRLSLVINRRA